MLDSATAERGGSFFGFGSHEITAALELEAGRRYELVVRYPRGDTPEQLAALRVGVREPLGADPIGAAVAAAREADAAVVVVGTDEEWETEGRDRFTMSLPGDQDELIRRVAAANPSTVIVVNVGAAIDMPWAEDVASIVVLWFPGMAGGEALAQVLVGDEEPGGRLPFTVPYALADVPCDVSRADPPGQLRYTEGLLIGHRWYLTKGVEPRWWFGHGLGYGDLRWGEAASRRCDVVDRRSVVRAGAYREPRGASGRRRGPGVPPSSRIERLPPRMGPRRRDQGAGGSGRHRHRVRRRRPGQPAPLGCGRRAMGGGAGTGGAACGSPRRRTRAGVAGGVNGSGWPVRPPFGYDEPVRIMLTNDDGIDSFGLHVLVQAIRPHGDVVVIAPDQEYSGAGAALGALQKIQPEAHRRDLDGAGEAWALTGPPALCVMFARLGAFGPPPDLVVSGINPGANVGRAVYHSGTVGAALTARNGGISGVAVSQAVAGYGVEGQGWDEMLVGQRWETAAAVAATVVGALVEARPAEPVVVNVNVPNLALSEIRGWRRTTVGTVPPRAMSAASLQPKEGHEDTFHVRMRWGDAVTLPPDTDGGAIERDEVSLTFLGRIKADDPDVAFGTAAALDELLGEPVAGGS